MKPTLEQLRVLEQTIISARGKVQVAIVDGPRAEMLLVEARELLINALQQIAPMLVNSESPPRCTCPAPGCPVHTRATIG